MAQNEPIAAPDASAVLCIHDRQSWFLNENEQTAVKAALADIRGE